jgi:hypothetical protein
VGQEIFTPLHGLWTELLRTMPETGMDYQVVELTEAGRLPLPALIPNADRAARRLGLPVEVRERPALGEADRELSQRHGRGVSGLGMNGSEE